MIQESTIVPLFKTFAELQRDEQEIIADFNAELDTAQKILDLTFAALRNDTLSKLDSADQALAKTTANRLLANNNGCPTRAKFDAQTAALTAVRDALLKRNRRLFGHDALSKRSARHIAALAARCNK